MNDISDSSMKRALPSEDEILQSLRFIVETHRAEFYRRREYQWKGIIAGLSFCALVIASRINKDTSAIILSINPLMISISLGALWVAGTVFLGFGHVANAFNKEIAHRAEHAIQNCINGEEYKPINLYEKKSNKRSLMEALRIGGGGYWGWLCESLLIFVFGFAATIVATTK